MVVSEDNPINLYSSVYFFPLQSGKQQDNVMDWLLPVQQRVQILKS